MVFDGLYALFDLLPRWFWLLFLAVWLVSEILIPGGRVVIEAIGKGRK